MCFVPYFKISLIFAQDRALEAQKLALEKTPGLGSRIDIVLTIVRIGFFFGDQDVMTEHMRKAEA